MKKYVENMKKYGGICGNKKKYVGNMKKYEESMQRYVENIPSLLYMVSGTS